MSESKAKAKVQRKTIIGNITANMRYEVLEHPGISIPDIDVDAATDELRWISKILQSEKEADG